MDRSTGMKSDVATAPNEREEDFGGVFTRLRVNSSADLPPPDLSVIDVAVLDMNCGWPNLGHDLLVRAVGEIADDLSPLLDAAGVRIRTISYDIRGRQIIPEAPGNRHLLYLGTGGPGHINPNQNDGVSPGTQGIREDPSWEAPLYRLFDRIRANEDAALLSVCHTFGVLCRWSDVAQPVLRSAEIGGKSVGVRENILTTEGRDHPWFSRFASELPDGRHLSVVDSRLFDLIPKAEGFPDGVTPIGYESLEPGGMRGQAVTMLEFARDKGGVMPRMLAVNHHPEARDNRLQQRVLRQKLSRGEVSEEWYAERDRTLRDSFSSRETRLRVVLTSQYTLMAPLRFHIYRQVRLRAERESRRVGFHEDNVFRLPSGTMERERNDF